MTTYIVLLRGINVSGKNKLPMAELRQLLKDAGFKNVQTYIQSGNIVIQSQIGKEEVVHNVCKVIKDRYGYEVPVLVKTIQEWKNAIGNNPFTTVDEKQQYFTFLSQKPSQVTIEIDAKEDEFKLIDEVVYVNAVGGYGTTKLNNNFFENKLKVNATTRNLKTTLKLLELATK
ncbi:uncharacterized protein (DUF1697 family) [Tenacibaculum adriaticum]|uniref:Uncharacterized protein (DUF1697 family) n=1 Tax=Tenacibaculum adriaticum TaxID=413713 RepID=A0A5S5DKF8_9FLAO|nr:DUF1697 domain-containing protein [Tenacibaculum adriaticum]TYP96443.1 uncharacterized protein (DUF1697 family) [Tenacibaculum adriaticum]